MTLYAQHGYGKSDKIEHGINKGFLNGVILSPKDETIANMKGYITELRQKHTDIRVMLDPQFYASTVSPLKAGKLLQYPYFKEELTRRDLSMPTSISSHVDEVISFQLECGLEDLVSPTVIIEDFQGVWSQIALNLAVESAEYTKNNDRNNDLYINLCMSREALKNREAIDEYLDMLSLLEVKGFYILVESDNTGDRMIDESAYENLLYLCYSLSEVNMYSVVVGYSDLVGIPLLCVGVDAIASGWFNGLNRFSLKKFQPSSGGRSPNPRYTSLKLMNKILLIPELQTISDQGYLDQVLVGTSYDGLLERNPSSDAWNRSTECFHNWEVLFNICQEISSKNSIAEKLDYLVELLEEAMRLYQELEEHTIPFSPSSNKNHLTQWIRSVSNFRELVGI